MTTPRTTDELVLGIIEVDETLGSLTPFIRAANQVVTTICQAAGLGDDACREVETWLAAHFYCSLDPRLTSEAARGISQSTQHIEGLLFASTTYGQMAMTLDTTGALAAYNKRLEKGHATTKPTITFLGCPSPRVLRGCPENC